MKTSMKYIWMLLATCWLVACTPENDFEEIPLSPEETENIESIKVTAHDFEGAENITRTLVEVGGEGATFKWAQTDTIGIFPAQGYQVAFPMSAGAGTQSAEFDGGGWALKPSTQYMAYYPFEYNNRSNKSVAVSYVGQFQKGNGNTDHLGAYDFMAATATTPSKGTVAFDFKHLGALLQFKLKTSAAANFTSMTLETQEHKFIRNGKLDLTAQTPAIQTSDKTTSLSMELSDIKLSAAGQEAVIYLMIAPVDLTGHNYTLKLCNDKGESTEATFTGQKFEAGKAYALTADLSAFEEATLQIADYRGKAIDWQGGNIQLEYLSNLECTYSISENAKDWLTVADSRVITKHTLTIHAEKNTTDTNRRGTITIFNQRSNLAVEYAIIQGSEGAYAITQNNGPLPVGILYSEDTPTSPEHGLANLVDGNLDTYYEVAASSFDIMWEGAYSTPVCSFEFGMCAGNYQIRDIWMYYSDNGKAWTGFNWGIGFGLNGSDHLSVLDGKSRSRYFKLEVRTNHGGSTTRLSEFGMKENTEADKPITNLEELVSHGTSFTKNDNTPMGNHYDNRHVTTDQDREWLANPANEPDLLPSASGYTLRSYPVTLYPFGEPVPADINQHGIGDCSALAVFAEMSYLFPDFIKSIITDHGDGTFTVAMFDPQGKPVDVTIQSTFLGDNNGIGASSSKDGKANWGTVLEKAIMKWNKIYQVNPDISGIGSEHVAPLFTGEGSSFAISPSSLLPEQLGQAAVIALENRMITIGGFTTAGLSHNYGPQTVTAHAYSFMLTAEADAMFAMRNPWGNSPGGTKTDDGVVNIYNDGVIPQTIDMRIIYPGAAQEYAVKDLTPYIPPKY